MSAWQHWWRRQRHSSFLLLLLVVMRVTSSSRLLTSHDLIIPVQHAPCKQRQRAREIVLHFTTTPPVSTCGRVLFWARRMWVCGSVRQNGSTYFNYRSYHKHICKAPYAELQRHSVLIPGTGMTNVPFLFWSWNRRRLEIQPKRVDTHQSGYLE